jgi:hypothetical protein
MKYEKLKPDVFCTNLKDSVIENQIKHYENT